MNGIYGEIYNCIVGLEIIDTHEHLPLNEEARDKDTDILKEYLIHYFNRDLISAGLSIEGYSEAINNKLPIAGRWKTVEPYWEAARYTGYGRALDISVRDLYGFDRICGSNLEQINDKFLKSLKPGHFRKVLKEKSRIRTSLLDNSGECDKDFFRQVYRLDNFICPNTFRDIRYVEKETGVKIHSLDDWLEACETALDKAVKSGIVALKSGLAYQRTLKYDRVGRKEAEDSFNSALGSRISPDNDDQQFTTGKHFQDYMMHFILRLAGKRNLTYQFHTGLQEGNGNIIYNSDPSLLTSLFIEYPDVDFDIFHIGYPYQNVLSALAKNFPNVYIDMCWAHIISPTACVNALTEWLDAVPANKISAFGGDYCFIDGVYGHQYLARENVSKALAKKVEEHVFSIEKAEEIALMLFYKNPVKIFKLEGRI